MTICRPSIAAGTTGQQSTSGRVATIIPPECWERWRGRPWASSASAAEPRPAACRAVRSSPSATLDVPVDLVRRPALRPARDALDLARRQPERLAQLADRAARAVGRERGDERRAVAAVALVHARDEDLADVAREVEVDVRQRGDLLVEEAPEEEVVGDRVDVREAGEVADDRGHRGAPARGPAAAGPARCPPPAPRPPPRARARAGRGAAGRTPTGRAGRSPELLLQARPPPRRAAGARAGSARRSARWQIAASVASAPSSSAPGVAVAEVAA